MKRIHTHRGRTSERGVIITLVAVFMLFVVGAMAVLAIDVVTFYTARSEAQLAADGAALAGARVLANSGMASWADPTLASNAAALCSTIAKQVAQSNLVGQQAPTTADISVTCDVTTKQYNPTVKVKIETDQPTFFARIWGKSTVKVGAQANAEAYNSSGLATGGTGGGPAPPVAPTCVKPWVIPNVDPRNGNQIFDTATGNIKNNPSSLVGWQDLTGRFHSKLTSQSPIRWKFYPGDQTSFAAPAQVPTCTFTPNSYQKSILGCVQNPLPCGSTVNLDSTTYTTQASLDTDTGEAVNCLTHAPAGASGGDSISVNPQTAKEPFQFLGGDNNPISAAQDADILVSNSLVTVPVYDNSATGVPPNGNTVTVIGFVQLFLNPDGNGVSNGPPPGHINTTIVNMVGCGTNATGPPYVYGNGPSAVPVRLITPP